MFKFTRAFLSAVLLSCAPTFAQDADPDVRATLDDGYWVIVGVTPEGSGPVETASIHAKVKKCGFQAFNDFSGKFSNFTPGHIVYVLGAHETKREAQAIQREVRRCVPDAYIKQGRYAGE